MSDLVKIGTSKLQTRLANKIMASHAGIGDKSLEIAQSLVELGLSPAMSSMLLDAVYRPTDALGRGQATRWKWFNAAVQRRYRDRLEKIRTNVLSFRNFLAEIDEFVDMRDTFKGEDYSFSYEQCFEFHELNLDAEHCLGILTNLTSAGYSKFQARFFLLSAVNSVKNRRCSDIQSAIESIIYSRESNNYDRD